MIAQDGTRTFRALAMAFSALAILFPAVVALSAEKTATEQAPKSREVLLLHLSDTHDITESSGKKHGVSLARVVTKAREVRSQAPDAAAFMVHSGDFLAPSGSSRTFLGQDIVRAMNASGIEVAAVGNHEFDYGVETLKQRLKETKFPIISSNVIDMRTGKLVEGIKPYHIIEKNGVRVAFVSAVTPDAAATLQKFGDPVKITDPVESLKEIVAGIRKRGEADLIIGLTHLEGADDARIAREVPGIDQILGGHEHVLAQRSVNGVTISKVRNDLQDLGVNRISLGRDKESTGLRIAFKQTEAIQLDRTIPEDSAVKAVIQDSESEVKRRLSKVLGELPEPLDGTWKGLGAQLNTGNAKLGEFVSSTFQRELGADAGLINIGVVSRSNKIYEAGPFRVSHLNEMVPYLDPPVLIETTGEKIRAVMEKMLERAVENKQFGAYPAFSGLEANWDLTLPPGRRITRLEWKGQPLAGDQKIKLSVNKYIYMSEPLFREAPLLTPLHRLKTEFEVLTEGLGRVLSPPRCLSVPRHSLERKVRN